VLDNYNINVDRNYLNLKLIVQPYYSIKGKELESGSDTLVKIEAKDAENKHPVDLEATFTSITDPMNVIKLANNAHPKVHIGTNSVVQHGFEYADIASGNSVTFDIEVKIDKKEVEGFTSKHEILNSHEIDLGLNSEEDKPHLIAFGTGGAMLVDAKEEKTHFLTCALKNQFATQCVQVGEVVNFGFVPEKHLDLIGDSIVGYSNHEDGV
jgi:hypothetical protein